MCACVCLSLRVRACVRFSSQVHGFFSGFFRGQLRHCGKGVIVLRVFFIWGFCPVELCVCVSVCLSVSTRVCVCVRVSDMGYLLHGFSSGFSVGKCNNALWEWGY